MIKKISLLVVLLACLPCGVQAASNGLLTQQSTVSGSGGGPLIDLGTSVTTPNPQASISDSTTGLYTSGPGAVDISISGVQKFDFNTTGLGIGTATPLTKLHINSNTNLGAMTPPTNSVLYISSVDGTGSNITLDGFGSPTAYSQRRSGGTAASPAALPTSVQIGVVGFGGYDGTSWVSNQASLRAQSTETWTSTAHGTDVQFLSTPIGTTAMSQRMQIGSGVSIGTTTDPGTNNLSVVGSVGVGTTTPASKLDVYGAINISGVNAISFPVNATNIAIGSSAAAGLTTGTNNTVIGYQVGSSALTIGTSNILIGVDSTTTVGTSTASFAVAIGKGAKANDFDVSIGYNTGGVSNASGHTDTDLHSVAIGYKALSVQNSTANQNTAVGDSACSSVTSADSLTCVGLWALKNLQVGSSNTALGDGACRTTTSASSTACIGHGSLYRMTTASDNTSVGESNLFNLTTGHEVTSMGQGVASAKAMTGDHLVLLGVDNTTDVATVSTSNAIAIGVGNKPGSGDIAIGNLALSGTTSDSNNNIAIGSSALAALGTSTQNTAVGYQALQSVATLGGNTAVGYQACNAVASGTLGGSTCIGHLAGSKDNGGGGNVYMGDQAGMNNVSGAENVIIGRQAWINGASNSNTIIGLNTYTVVTTGGSNTGVGQDTGKFFGTTSHDNTTMGQSAMKSVTGQPASNYNSAYGSGAMQNYYGTGDANNVAVGVAALAGNGTTSATFTKNVAVGMNAGLNETTGSQNVLLGYGATINSQTASNNTMVGYQAGPQISSGGGNTIIGASAGGTCATGSSIAMVATGINSTCPTSATNTIAVFGVNARGGTTDSAFGPGALFGTTTDNNQNAAFGYQALTGNTSGSNNTAMGFNAGQLVTIGTSNLILGANVASTTLTTGSGNVLIGVGTATSAGGSGVAAAGTSNTLNIMNDIFGTSMTGTLASPAGNIGIGTATPLATLDVNGTVKTQGYAIGSLPSGVIGMRAYVTDQLTTCAVAGAALTAGGSAKCPVFYNGSAWVGD